MPSMRVRALAACAFLPGLVAAEAPLGLTDGVQLVQVAVAGLVSPDSTFLDNEGVACLQGPARVLEVAAAVKKASPVGGLYNASFVRLGPTCEERGYSFEGDDDQCAVGVRAFFRSEADQSRFRGMESQALYAYTEVWSVPNRGTAVELLACTCHPKSPTRARLDGRCGKLAAEGKVGSYVVRHPTTSEGLICYEGPFEHTARVFATQKSSPLLPMHQYDQVAPVACSAQGFEIHYTPTDDCWPLMSMYTRTEEPMHDCPPGGLGEDNLDCDDLGMLEARKLAEGLANGSFKPWAEEHGLTAVLHNKPECNCLAPSPVEKCKESSSPLMDFLKDSATA